jgi:hypothetical protein
MLDPEGALTAALDDVASRAADQLARELIDAAQRHGIPLPALLAWVHDRPPPRLFAPSEFLRWAERYKFTAPPAVQTHPQIDANTPGNPRTPPEDP